LSKDYKQGVLQGLQHSLYSTILVAQRGKIWWQNNSILKNNQIYCLKH
jgi:hypothetical protein